MAKTKSSSSSKKDKAALETSESIAAQTEAFLKKGGKIEPIQVGTSGIDALQSRGKHIVISSKHRT